MNQMENKRVLVVGMGKSGIAAAQAMIALGADVSVQDSKHESEMDVQLINFLRGKNVTCYFGCEPEDMSIFDLLILSPGVPPTLPFLLEGKEKGAEIVGELELA